MFSGMLPTTSTLNQSQLNLRGGGLTVKRFSVAVEKSPGSQTAYRSSAPETTPSPQISQTTNNLHPNHSEPVTENTFISENRHSMCHWVMIQHFRQWKILDLFSLNSGSQLPVLIAGDGMCGTF